MTSLTTAFLTVFSHALSAGACPKPFLSCSAREPEDSRSLEPETLATGDPHQQCRARRSSSFAGPLQAGAIVGIFRSWRKRVPRPQRTSPGLPQRRRSAGWPPARGSSRCAVGAAPQHAKNQHRAAEETDAQTSPSGIKLPRR